MGYMADIWTTIKGLDPVRIPHFALILTVLAVALQASRRDIAWTKVVSKAIPRIG